MKKQKILVVGSSNTDMVVQTRHLPRPGETVLGGTFLMNPGGKGANQAVAAVRLGGDTTFICKTGNDMFGRQALQQFRDEGIDTEFMLADDHNASGVALIVVDDAAENTIVVASGANAHLTADDLRRADEAIRRSDIVLMQLETPIPTIEYVAAEAKRLGKRVVLNPAPACALPPELLDGLFLITPNETEAELLAGIPVTDPDSARRAADKLLSLGIANVVVTLGSKGALVHNASQSVIVPAHKVKAVDTTAAGDVFNGALVVALAEGRSLVEAAEFAARAAAISVTRIGAQASAPYRKELE
ncbi:MAG: ribokinase [Rikenellaceae bacterium]|nr:ribokinase [Rikenellaceae bacterium]